MADVTNVTRIDTGDYSKKPYTADSYQDLRGVVDFGNLIQFAPYEGGYCFLGVINGPAFMNEANQADHRDELQKAFIKILEQEFKGLDGIEGISTETMEISDEITSMSLISKVVQNTNCQVSMRFTEKSGSLLTKYISTFLRFIKDPKSQAKTYGGLIGYGPGQKSPETYPGFHMEVFNMLYVVTDSTCLNVEKAFLLLNAQPTTAAYDELYNASKGQIEIKELSVPFNCFVVDGKIPNKIAQEYLKTLVNTTDTFEKGKINVNSWNYDWSFANGNGQIKKVGDLSVDTSDPSRGGYLNVKPATTKTP